MINVNKLFRRLSIRAKLVIAFVFLSVVPVALIGGYGAVFSFLLLSERLLDQVKFGVTTKAGDIQNFLSNVKEDVLFLSRLPTFRQLIDLPDTASAARQSLVNRLGGEFLAFSRAHKAYYQVRYIDQRGMEIVRADFGGKQSFLTPPDQLQNKEDRYYFREAIQFPPDEVYVSPMDLNIERGQVEVPDKPVVRYATPVINSHGKSRGIVIINIYASYILGQVLALRQDKRGITFLADNEGSYLSHSERTKANGGYFSLTAADNLKNDFPQPLAGEILSGKPGALAGPGASGKIVAFAPISPYAGERNRFWVIVQAYNKAEVLSSIRSFQVLIFVLGGLVLAIAVTAGIAAARHFTKPILQLSRGAEIVAGGNFDYPIKVETNDEIEELACRFNIMTQKLKEHEGQLRAAHERLEMKAREVAALEERERIS
ncbi:MAG: HAMP domain-containing protein, partial [Deltaproteobacteria bacterium]|nr:HAMP domain-containing protein [Deltaproteobacteria bacterium]